VAVQMICSYIHEVNSLVCPALIRLGPALDDVCVMDVISWRMFVSSIPHF
jgi:hypothetical protein